MKFLVGHTGFVGQNLKMQTTFDGLFNSTNISESYGHQPDLLVFSGLRAEKYLANHEPFKDRACIDEAFANIIKIAPRKLVLISTIDVFHEPINVDEYSSIDLNMLHPYGKNRRLLEIMVTKYFPDALIVRLPGLFGFGLKKNFLYDLIHVIPTMLSSAKLAELTERDNTIKKYFKSGANGFYHCSAKSEADRRDLRGILDKIGFSAADFTDSRSVFQFYNLEYLWSHIQKALENDVTIFNMATEPIKASELHQRLLKREFVNEISLKPPFYDFRTCHASMCGSPGPYLFCKETVLTEIEAFFKFNTSFSTL
ncbi:MAG: hypothetical protein LUG50_00835 [Planctomycetaceae bacterium]|nr:hypothetical protein [Planctomycetaceae bacterium]